MTIDELITDIRATFPKVRAMLREDCISGKKVWMIGGEGDAEMPDGLPIFSQFYYGEETYDGDVHTAFEAWLGSRGFYLENHDGFWHCPTPIPTAEQLAEWERQYQIDRAAYLAGNL